MSPSILFNTHQSLRRSSDTASSQFAEQWTRPSDIFSVLLILGGDVIQLACASMAGSTSIPPNPVTFSFGWVAYSVSALLSAIGGNRLICCPPEVAMTVINLQSGYRRSNNSWLLGRLMKTYKYWMPEEVKHRLCGRSNEAVPSRSVDEENVHITTAESAPTPSGLRAALCIAVYRWRNDLKPKVPTRDWVWWSGYAISSIQLGIAAIPLGLYGDWGILLTIACGTVLAYSSASLPQWREEKWKSRISKKSVALTQGNGSQNVIIIEGTKDGLDLEDLAAGRAPEMPSTRFLTPLLSLLWLILLINCTGIQSNTWYLLAAACIGMLHNIVVAATPRMPEAMGLPIELKPSDSQPDAGEIFAEQKVMWTLMELENKYPDYGRALRDEFFPGQLWDWEKKWWAPETNMAERRQLLLDARNDMKEKEKEEKTKEQDGKERKEV